MCDAEYEWAAELLEKGRTEGEAKGRAKGRAEGILPAARNMIAQALNDGLIATVTGLPIAEAQALRAEMPR